MTLEAQTRARLKPLPDIVEPCRVLTAFELEFGSEVFTLLDRGLAVHTSFLIETEKIASGSAFAAGSSAVMIATSTLAQGLNLPATAVFIGGTKIGYSPREEEDSPEIRDRRLSQLLNAAGRAGRAGFANQGLVIAIPDRPDMVEGSADIDILRRNVDFLQHADNAVKIESSLDHLLDTLATGTLNYTTADRAELQVMSQLTGDGTQSEASERVLECTYAAFRRRRAGLTAVSSQTMARLQTLREEFVTAAGTPPWLPLAAQKCGLDFFNLLALVHAWKRAGPAPEGTVDSTALNDVSWWTKRLLEIVAYMPPKRCVDHFGLQNLPKASAQFKKMLGNMFFSFEESPNWKVPSAWLTAWREDVSGTLTAWMTGASYREIAGLLLAMPAEKISPARNRGDAPIPKVISLVDNFFSSLSLLAGGLLAIAEQDLGSYEPKAASLLSQPPPALGGLSMCIAHGFDSLASLAWYRFGLHLRRPAHLLADAFPPPDPFCDDNEMRRHVESARRRWLSDPAQIPQALTAYSKQFRAMAEFIQQSD